MLHAPACSIFIGSLVCPISRMTPSCSKHSMKLARHSLLRIFALLDISSAGKEYCTMVSLSLVDLLLCTTGVWYCILKTLQLYSIMHFFLLICKPMTCHPVADFFILLSYSLFSCSLCSKRIFLSRTVGCIPEHRCVKAIDQ